MSPKTSGIYKIQNLINGKVYIGQTRNFANRWAHHRYDLNSGVATNSHLQRAWNKYGEDNFEFSVVEECDVEKLNEREVYWIDKHDSFNNGYNQSIGGGGVRGWKMSESSKEKIRLALTGIPKSDEARKNNAIAQKEYYQSHINSRSKEVVCLNTREVFPNSTIAAHHFGIYKLTHTIRKCCNGELRAFGTMDNGERLVWADKKDFLKMSEDEIANRIIAANSRNGRYNAHARKVICLDTNIIYDCITDAANQTNTNINSIISCCRGRRFYAGGKRWAYLSDYKNGVPTGDYKASA